MRTLLIVVLLLIVVGLVVVYWKRLPANATTVASKNGPLTTAIVAPRDINFAVTAASDIGPPDAVSVRPEIGGLISKLTLDIGDKVRKGDILFELDDKDLQIRRILAQDGDRGLPAGRRDSKTPAGEGEAELRTSQGSVRKQARGAGRFRQRAPRHAFPCHADFLAGHIATIRWTEIQPERSLRRARLINR